MTQSKGFVLVLEIIILRVVYRLTNEFDEQFTKICFRESRLRLFRRHKNLPTYNEYASSWTRNCVVLLCVYAQLSYSSKFIGETGNYVIICG
jgi:hypothetical protein